MAACSLLKDVEKLEKTVVLIDVFRSSNTIIERLHQGVKTIVPVASLKGARELKRKNPSWILAGERNGDKLPDFDLDNSPVSTIPPDLKSETMILTTTSGTKCLNFLDQEQRVYIGSFINAQFLINYLREQKVKEVSFWAVGVSGEQVAEEDELCAVYLENLWRENTCLDPSSISLKLKNTPGAQRLQSKNQQADLAYCVRTNERNIVPQCIKCEDSWSIQNVVSG